MVKSTTLQIFLVVAIVSFFGLLVIHRSLNIGAFSKAGKFIRKSVLADQAQEEEVPDSAGVPDDDSESDEDSELDGDTEFEVGGNFRPGSDDPAEDTWSNVRQRLPKALIIGFSKCGTTALRTFLTLHPNIVSPIEEVRYFNFNYTKGLDWYRRQMPPSTEDQITLEKTPSYIMSPIVLKRIYLFDSRVKLIIIIRDPIVRLQSQYAHSFRNVPEGARKPDFKIWVKGDSSENRITHFVGYTKYIRQVYDQFPKDQILVLAEEDFEQNPLSVMKEVEEFLGLEPAFSKEMFYFNKEKGFYCFNREHEFFPTVLKMVKVNSRTGCLGEDKGRDHPDIDEDFHKELVQFIRPHNEQLFRLIGKRIVWENFE
ncbi:hypothetical protein EGW08_000907 [Elysia chlorotica]|uniref:Sulfotransferase domain-containing protein n=1 Tax=Elysia chlorotica TaxID=188477 RepID=A0A3S1AGE5_ELYCH|nr:hypothetical protein EGW08_000907 [Elysia chlorotica]